MCPAPKGLKLGNDYDSGSNLPRLRWGQLLQWLCKVDFSIRYCSRKWVSFFLASKCQLWVSCLISWFRTQKYKKTQVKLIWEKKHPCDSLSNVQFACVADTLNLLYGLDECVGRLQRRLCTVWVYDSQLVMVFNWVIVRKCTWCIFYFYEVLIIWNGVIFWQLE